jgi:carbonic anhydrase
MAKNNNNRIFLITVFVFAVILLLALLMTSRGAAKYEEKKIGKDGGRKIPPIVQAYVARTESPLEPGRALELLQEGNKRYVTNHRLPDPGIGEESRKFLTLGEWPYAVILTSSDSRVPPEYLFDAGLGDLTVIRVIGPVADRTVIASVENAMMDGKCRLLVVMGHKESRAIRNAINAVEYPDMNESYNLDAVAQKIIPAVLKAKKTSHLSDSLKKAVACENINMVIQQIKAGSNDLQRLVNSGKISMVGAYVEISSGKVEFLSGEKK